MPSIIVYLDDSAEERRRRRRRILEVIIILALLGIAAARRPQAKSQRAAMPPPTVVTETIYVSTDTQGPYQPPPAPIPPAQPAATELSDGEEPVKPEVPVAPAFIIGNFPVVTRWPDVTIPIDRIGEQKVLRARIAPRHIHFIRPGSKRVIVSNPHDEPIHVRRIVLEGVGYELKGDEKCTTLLNPGQSCTFSVVAKLVSSYTPTAHLTIE